VLELLAALEIVSLTDDVRAIAASAEPPELRTLDAVQLACAITLGAKVDAIASLAGGCWPRTDRPASLSPLC